MSFLSVDIASRIMLSISTQIILSYYMRSISQNVLRHFPGHTMLNHLNGRIMQDRKSQKNFERALLHEMEKIKIAARQWHNNNTKGYRDFRSKEAISKSFAEIAVLCMG